MFFPALLTLFTAGEQERRTARDRRLSRFTELYTDLVDGQFFETLWEAAELPVQEAQVRWDDRLHRSAYSALQEAIRSSSLPAARREKAIARAEIAFHRNARFLMTDLYEQGAPSDDRSTIKP